VLETQYRVSEKSNKTYCKALCYSWFVDDDDLTGTWYKWIV